MPSLSVVIPVYRQLRCLDLTLAALAAQLPKPADLEIIVVDDGSGDETGSVVASYQSALPARLIKLGVNRGRAAARNAGAAAADADRLLLLDADSYADPGLLAAHARFARSFPDQVLLGARAEATWLPLADQAASRADASGGYSRDVRLKLGLDAKTFPVSQVPWYFAFSHNMSLPTADFLGCGGFDENFTGWGFEDIEFGYRLHVASGRRPGYFQFDPLAMCHHLPHFRSAESNWMQAGPMLPYFVEKHRSLEVEFIDEGPQVVVDLLPAYLSRLTLLHRADRVAGKQALATLPPATAPGRLVMGIGLAGCLPADDLTEGIDHQPPDPRTTPGLIGLRLPYPNGQFADLVNLDLWRVLSPDHLSRMVLESLRVAGTVHLGYSAAVTETELISSPDYVRDMLSGHHEVTLSEPAPGLLWISARPKLP
jgi:GT2 family glycosyltransferase